MISGIITGWQARLGRGGKLNLGILRTEVEAAEAVDEAAAFVYGR